MSEDRRSETTTEDEPFLSRWSRRKQEASATTVEPENPLSAETEEVAPPLTDADMPPLESLDENSDYGGFLSPEVSDALRQAALQKLFRCASFNVCDGLDDYAEDFTKFEKLGDVMTAELRYRLQQEAERAAEKAESAVAEQETTPEDTDAQRLAEKAEAASDSEELQQKADAAVAAQFADDQEERPI